MKLLSVIAGGGLGALLRYIVSGATYKALGSTFPWGTLMVNLVGSFLIGLLWALSERVIMPPHLRTFLFIGVLGAFTTFSTYSLETAHLLREGEFGLALWNLMLSNGLGIILVLVGFTASRYLVYLFR
ncbi:MAG: fluoride efflux transporter CrcB [Acidobacteria bacterium]|nr:MAG: fluoride efflux transporter CrcB [Acidobacteriota bacterium]